MCPFSSTRAGGVVYYALSIMRDLADMIPDRLVVFCYDSGRELIDTVPRPSEVRVVQLNHEWELFHHADRIDVLFSPYYLPDVFLPDLPRVNFIPDIQERYYPEYFSRAVLQHRRAYYEFSARTSTVLITPSQYTKRTILEQFQIPEKRIAVIGHGCHPAFADPDEHGRRPLGLPEWEGSYLFFPANSWRHKNHLALLDALTILKEQYEISVPCVFGGHLEPRDPNHVDIPAEIKTRGLSDTVVHLGNVGLKQLKYLYTHGLALVCPSLYEGFGIPLVEAMVTGCPIVASDRTSVPEIAGNAALYFNPEDPNDIARKLKSFLDNPEERDTRVRIGLEMGRNFSDRKTAEETLRVLDRACQEAGELRIRVTAATLADSKMPIVSALFIMESCPGSPLVRELEALMHSCGDALQVIVAVRPGDERETRTLLPSSVKVVQRAGTLKQTLLSLSESVRGSYLILSDGKSIPAGTFIAYLASPDWDPEEAPDLLCGESYHRDGVRSQPWCFTMPARAGSESKSVCCNNLSLAIRAESLFREVERANVRLESLHDVVFLLWDRCSRQATWQAVNEVYGPRLTAAHYYASKLQGIAIQQLGQDSSLVRMMELVPVSLALKPAVYFYGVLPQRLRHTALQWAKQLVSIGSSLRRLT